MEAGEQWPSIVVWRTFTKSKGIFSIRIWFYTKYDLGPAKNYQSKHMDCVIVNYNDHNISFSWLGLALEAGCKWTSFIACPYFSFNSWMTFSLTISYRFSLSRINAYKALASPSLICLSSKDPILTGCPNQRSFTIVSLLALGNRPLI